MKHEVAKMSIEKINRAVDLLNESIAHVHESESQDIALVYRAKVDKAQEILQSRLLNPLYRQHRTLMPDGLDLGEEYLNGRDDSGL